MNKLVFLDKLFKCVNTVVNDFIYPLQDALLESEPKMPRMKTFDVAEEVVAKAKRFGLLA